MPNNFLSLQQWADTKNTVNNINKMINDNFLDEHAPVVS